ncbi:hypothetical protein Swit_5275 (plasmid) [Rhizorhabdus wittichii RW1]|jgi:hypothetical protein|uniref:Uncharacterized protein n=1 Tax=Rhizorhabdus wittichii (strain DSM 6014 / CCUG 31198 / JCM 15750 / NBRC 105917 / EY 4224 / RW1) TaxID=392499 RepID=A0A9J9HGR5_RHIWR|nr:hypothetical protein Swit_5275 [Rhizorhabdus wittichii RW1]
MRTTHKLLLGGCLAASLVGGVAYAASHEHKMTVDLPGGESAHITYFGDTPPQVKISQTQPDQTDFVDAAFQPFARMDRISAVMDAQMNAMMRRVADLHAQSADVTASEAPHFVSVSGLPKGAQVRYSYSSTTIGPNGCAQSVTWTSDGTGNAQPKMTKTSTGDCSAAVKPQLQTTSGSAQVQAGPSHTT